MRTVDRVQALLAMANLYEQRAKTSSAGSRQALENLAARHARVARQLTRQLRP